MSPAPAGLTLGLREGPCVAAGSCVSARAAGGSLTRSLQGAQALLDGEGRRRHSARASPVSAEDGSAVQTASRHRRRVRGGMRSVSGWPVLGSPTLGRVFTVIPSRLPSQLGEQVPAFLGQVVRQVRGGDPPCPRAEHPSRRASGGSARLLASSRPPGAQPGSRAGGLRPRALFPGVEEPVRVCGTP